MKVGVLVAVGVLSALLAPVAGAANWHTNGDRAFSSTNAGISRMVIHPHQGGSIVTAQCPTSSMAGTIGGPTNVALPWAGAMTLTPFFGAPGNCTVNGVAGYSLVCSSAEVNALGYSGGDTLATAGGGITNVSLTSIDCRLSAGPTTCSTITGVVQGHYINPSPITTGAGSLTITNAGQSLTVDDVGLGCAAVADGTVTWGSPNGTGVGDATYVVDGPHAPYIYRGT